MGYNRIKYVLVLLLILPVFFINIKHSHDWGDDFAQYITQAMHISKGISQMQTGYIFNPYYMLGPPSYPSGFPLLLVPVYDLFGNSIFHFDLYISLFLLFLALLMFHFFTKHFPDLFSALLVIVFIYNPWTLNFKMEINSDIPFTLLLLACVLLYQKFNQRFWPALFLALLIGFMSSVRTVGLVFILAIALDCIRQLLMQKSYSFKNLISPVLISIGGFLFYLLINKVLFPSISGGAFSYSYHLDYIQSEHFILNNIQYNLNALLFFFEPWNEHWQFISILCGTMIFSFILLGVVKKLSTGFDFTDGLVLIYLLAVFLYPLSNTGFRFILPLVPYLLFYAVQGLRCIQIQLPIKHNALAIVLTLFILLSYQKGWSMILASNHTELRGPQEKESVEAFNYINNHTADSARFNFSKPRALALYAGRQAMSTRPLQSLSGINQSLLNNHITYLLINDELSDDSLKMYVKVQANTMALIWSNAGYQLFKLHSESDSGSDFRSDSGSNTRLDYWKSKIMNNKDWFELIQKKAAAHKVPVDSMVLLDAKYMLDQENKN